MRFLSCFSGIEAASVAWRQLGWTCCGVAEIEPFPCAVLAHRFPDVPNLGSVLADDFLNCAAAPRPDVLVGGPPCQDFSVAGLRAGIHGARGNLTLRWVQIIHATRPRFALTENVPGWLSANGGHAFGAFLAGLVGHDTALVPPKDCGGQWTNAGMVAGPGGRAAWRILDAQYFGLAQRRKRVFVVCCPGDGADPAAVLFERAGLRGHTSPRHQEGEGTARCLTRGSGGGQRYDGETETFVPVANTLRVPSHGAAWRGDGCDNFVAHSLRADGFDASEDGTGRGTPLVTIGSWQQNSMSGKGTLGYDADTQTLRPVKPQADHQMLQLGAAVRRLTPREAERLQGFPDDYTAIPWRGGMAPDGPRYKALGNSMAVPVMAWIGERISLARAG